MFLPFSRIESPEKKWYDAKIRDNVRMESYMRRKASLLKQMILYFSIAFSLLFSAFGSIILHYNTESFRDRATIIAGRL